MGSEEKPLEIQGIGKVEDRPCRLADAEFTTFSPPDVHPTTRILAVVGPDDISDASAPSADGWFQSDFYLFHYLLRVGPPTQTWLTCISPRALVEKYGQFTHGDPKGDRRVVLDASILPEIAQDGDVRVVDEKNLLDTFLSCLKTESNLAVTGNVQLLVLVFGHGEINNGIVIGRASTGQAAPKLFVRDLAAKLNPDARVSLLTTSCYSGGWIMRPSVLDSETLDDPEKPKFARHADKARVQAASTIFTTAIMEELVEAERPRWPKVADVVRDNHIPACTDYLDIAAEAVKRLDILWQSHEIDCGTDDHEPRTRIGFPLAAYERRWNQLRKADKTRTLGSKLPADDDSPPLTTSIGEHGLFNIVRARADIYLGSCAGTDDAELDTAFHTRLRKLVKGKDAFDITRLGDFALILAHRSSMIQLATDFKNDTTHWYRSIDGDIKTCDEKRKIYDDIVDNACECFPSLGRVDMRYSDPGHYLAIALVESGLQAEEAEEKLDMCQNRMFRYSFMRIPCLTNGSSKQNPRRCT
jgi:hypothetical protein